MHAGKPVRIKIQGRHQLRRPAALDHVKKRRSRSIRDVRGEFSSETKSDVVLWQKHLADFRVNFRFVGAHPHELRRRKARQRRVTGNLDQAIIPDTPRNPVGFGLAALITPDNRGPENLVVLAQQHQPMHLPGQSDSPYLLRFGRGALQQLADCQLRGTPPILWILLCPLRLWCADGLMICRLAADHRSFLIHQDCSCSSGTNINAKVVAH